MKRTVKGNTYIKQPWEIEIELPFYRKQASRLDVSYGTWYHFKEDGSVYVIRRTENGYEIQDGIGEVDDYSRDILTDADGDYTCTKLEFQQVCADVMVYLSRSFV